jgi:hypothetical protein
MESFLKIYGLYFFRPSSKTRFKTCEKLTELEDVLIIFAWRFRSRSELTSSNTMVTLDPTFLLSPFHIKKVPL